MSSPDSRHPAWHQTGRIALAVLQTVMPMSTGILEKKQARYWQELPLRRMTGVLLALFLTVSSWGFFIDLADWKRQPIWALLISASTFGATGVTFFLIVRRRMFRLIPVLALLGLAIAYVPRWLPHGPHIPISDAARQRIALDGLCIMAASLLGYRLFLLFINTEGAEQVRTRTELDLACSMQQMLVPPVVFSNPSFEAYGVSLPSEQVGGDLVDLIPTDSGWLACLADVSGHGIRAGLLMGNLKTALRFGFARDSSLPGVISAVSRILPQVKPAEMYATFVGLRFAGERRVEYLVAGHPPILHYRVANNKTERHGMVQFPLGLTSDCAYDSCFASYVPGDLFVLLSDGVIETENANGLEFGFEGVERVLLRHGTDSLKEIMDRLVAELGRFGYRRDDQTILLIRALA